MPTRNVPLLRGTLAHVEANPDEHDQATWGFTSPCGSSFCYAGHAIRIGRPDAEWQWVPLFEGTEVESSETLGAAAVELPLANGDTRYVTVWEAAKELLGLTAKEAWELFDGDNSLDDLRRIVGELCDGVPA